MSGVYEEIEIEDMAFDEQALEFTYPCPCGGTVCLASSPPL